MSPRTPLDNPFRLLQLETVPGDIAPEYQNSAPVDVPPHTAFETIREKRAYERRCLPFLKTIVDFDIACEIGFHQISGAPLTVKQLLLLNLAPAVTVLRRVDRLCLLGAVTRTRGERDRRVQFLRLAPHVLRLYADYERLGGRGGSRNERGDW